MPWFSKRAVKYALMAKRVFDIDFFLNHNFKSAESNKICENNLRGTFAVRYLNRHYSYSTAFSGRPAYFLDSGNFNYQIYCVFNYVWHVLVNRPKSRGRIHFFFRWMRFGQWSFLILYCEFYWSKLRHNIDKIVFNMQYSQFLHVLLNRYKFNKSYPVLNDIWSVVLVRINTISD